MTELRGLQNIIGASATLHTLREPPRREDFADDWRFEAAYSEWWASMHLWTGTVANIEEG